MDNHSPLFVDNYNILVLKNHIEGDVLRNKLHFLRLRKADAYLVTNVALIIFPHRGAVYQHITLLQKALGSGAA